MQKKKNPKNLILFNFPAPGQMEEDEESVQVPAEGDPRGIPADPRGLWISKSSSATSAEPPQHAWNHSCSLQLFFPLCDRTAAWHSVISAFKLLIWCLQISVCVIPHTNYSPRNRGPSITMCCAGTACTPRPSGAAGFSFYPSRGEIPTGTFEKNP